MEFLAYCFPIYFIETSMYNNWSWERLASKLLILPTFRSSAILEKILFLLILFLRSHGINTETSHFIKAKLQPTIFVAPHIFDRLFALFWAKKNYSLEKRRCRNLTYWLICFFCFVWFEFKSFSTIVPFVTYRNLSFKHVATTICHYKGFSLK